MDSNSTATYSRLYESSLDLFFYPEVPERIAFTVDLLSPFFHCIVKPENEAHQTADYQRVTRLSTIVMVVNVVGLDDCCDALRKLAAVCPKVPILVLTDGVETTGIELLLSCGATDFAELHNKPADILLRIRRIAGILSAYPPDPSEVSQQMDPAMRHRLIGNAPEFLKLLKRMSTMARSNASVILLGETGTGKEVCAQAIHYCSPRSQGPWVAINCAAIPNDLIEDELYGHVRGAYTHAHISRGGMVREAEGGTLFLDEVDSLSLAAQAKLLRFLQDGEYRAIGSCHVHHADVRILAASNSDLRLAVLKGRFREDLFFRLNTLTLTIPPLRERRQDIAPLAASFFDEANVEAGKRLSGFSPGALQRLIRYDWPGNVRELKHVVQRAVVLAEHSIVQATDIELEGQHTDEPAVLSFREAKARAVESFERCYLEQLLAQNQGNISRAARTAQKNRRAFFELLRRHAIDASRFRKTDLTTTQ